MKFAKPYTIHITRRQDWFDKKEYNAISLLEWLNYVHKDEQMEVWNKIHFPFKKLGLADQDFIYKSDGLSVWKVHAFKGRVVLDTHFEYERGNIDVTSPDDETIRKMISIAKKLDAKVQGDNGEIYDETYFPVATTTKVWWKFWP